MINSQHTNKAYDRLVKQEQRDKRKEAKRLKRRHLYETLENIWYIGLTVLLMTMAIFFATCLSIITWRILTGTL